MALHILLQLGGSDRGFNRNESFTIESTCFFRNTRSSILQRIQNNLKKNSVPYECKHDEVSFIQQGYSFTILHTPNLHADIPVN